MQKIHTYSDPDKATGQLLRQVELVIADLAERGREVEAVSADLASLPPSLDAIAALVDRLATLPIRADWPWDEPDDLDGIRAAAVAWPGERVAPAPADIADRVGEAFLARVAGCVLGKPFEFDPTLDELAAALEPVGEWPLADYVSEAGVARLRHRIPQWAETVRERIAWVAPDDDINYTLLALLLLERHGATFATGDVRDLWLLHLPLAVTFGPERTALVRAGAASLDGGDPTDPASWADRLNPRAEWCGALIRVDAYGWACAGDPGLAAELAWRDARLTHRGSGLYGAMFVAALLSLLPVRDDPMDAVVEAIDLLPARSRLASSLRASLSEVLAAADWIDGYRRIHARWPELTHCRIVQELGTLVNTLRFAPDPGRGICMQVMQGNDTDSFGATAGSALGLLHGPGSLDRRWIEPFRDDLRCAVALFHERSLSAVAERMARLPSLLSPDGRVTNDLPY